MYLADHTLFGTTQRGKHLNSQAVHIGLDASFLPIEVVAVCYPAFEDGYLCLHIMWKIWDQEDQYKMHFFD